MRHLLSILLVSICGIAPPGHTAQGQHLFILSGQSNMERLDPARTLVPALAAELGEENLLVVKQALGGQSIRRWYRGASFPGRASVDSSEPAGDLYESLLQMVKNASVGKPLQSVTLIWMQGERDAKERQSSTYEASLSGLINQLERDLQCPGINVVIGRLSDYGLARAFAADWIAVREAQMRVAESRSSAAWVNTDDLNDGRDDRGRLLQDALHYSAEGYDRLGYRFATAAIDLIRRTPLTIDQ